MASRRRKTSKKANVSLEDSSIAPVEALFQQRYVQLNVEHILGVGTAQERAKLQCQLTNDIADLDAALLLWKKSVIASASVSRLPLEVLQNIFSHVAALEPPITPLHERVYDPEGNDGDRELDEPRSFNFHACNGCDGGSLGFIRISHVCQSWRSALLPMRSLWAGIIGILPLATKKLIDRAGSHPLSLTLRESSQRQLCLSDTINDHLSHSFVRSIRASFTEDNEIFSSFPDFVDYVVTQKKPWSALKHLEISANGTLDSSPDDPPLVAPALISANMINCTLPFVARSLQHLSIVYDTRRSGYNEMTIEDLIEDLDVCRDTLEELELFQCISIQRGNQPNSSPVHFSALRRFAIGGHLAGLLDLALEYIRTPVRCDVSFHALRCEADEGVYDYGYNRPDPPPSSDRAFHLALRVFADELLKRHVSYGLALDGQSSMTPSISVRETTQILPGPGSTDLFAEQPEGARSVYFDPHFFRRYLVNDPGRPLMSALGSTLERGEESDLSALADVRTFSVGPSNKPLGEAYDVAKVFARTTKIEALQLHVYDQAMLKGICDPSACRLGLRDEKKQFVLPELAVLRLSAGPQPLSCAELLELLGMRAKEVEAVKEAKQLLRLIVDKDVMLLDPEKEGEAVQQLKKLVDDLQWRLS